MLTSDEHVWLDDLRPGFVSAYPVNAMLIRFGKVHGEVLFHLYLCLLVLENEEVCLCIYILCVSHKRISTSSIGEYNVAAPVNFH